MTGSKPRQTRFTLFPRLVLSIFAILLMAGILAGLLGLFFFKTGILAALAGNWFPTLLFILLVPSIIIGTVLTAIAGKWALKPFNRIIKATQEIAAGNFPFGCRSAGRANLGC